MKNGINRILILRSVELFHPCNTASRSVPLYECHSASIQHDRHRSSQSFAAAILHRLTWEFHVFETLQL